MIKKIIISGIPEASELLMYELQNGFYVEAVDGETLNSFLIKSCTISESYIADKVKTIFHNGNPVDNPGSVVIHNGSVCALSGAMPGLAGAMMRINSPYSSMRKNITAVSENSGVSGETVYVRLKLFNMIMRDLGGGFISSGIILQRDTILKIIKKIETLHGSCFSFISDGLISYSKDIDKLPDDKYMAVSAN